MYIFALHCKAARGLLGTDFEILNHGQVMNTTSERTPPLQTSTPNQRKPSQYRTRNRARCFVNAFSHVSSLVALFPADVPSNRSGQRGGNGKMGLGMFPAREQSTFLPVLVILRRARIHTRCRKGYQGIGKIVSAGWSGQ
ncbi:hypothetical protein TNCV_3910531 [Trichonephila clavipes]|nr:hypothetical protein TNCV_3910531 [Trichonephila clavipes]